MSTPRQFRKKPVVVEAVQYTGKNSAEIGAWMGAPEWAEEFASDDMTIKTLEGEMHVSGGDWIIKGVAVEFYPCKTDIFEATYEPVTEDSEA